ncbi:hypothetical protein P7C71_g6154, partial [Lecanoromycetidae sp. Uapishka_2]
MLQLTYCSIFAAIGALTPSLAWALRCSDQQTPIAHDDINRESSVDQIHVAKKQTNEYCSRNYECESGCCDYEKVVPGYGWGMCGTGCWWLTNNFDGIQDAVTGVPQITSPANDTCRHAIEFGVPTAYKLKAGTAAIVKVDNNMQTDPFGDGSVFYSVAKKSGIALWVMKGNERDWVTKDLTFGTDSNNAATFNVFTSHHGRLLTALNREGGIHGYVSKKVEYGSGVGRVQISSRIEDAAMFTFTQYVQPKWENDSGPTRVNALLDLIDKVCKPGDKECADTLVENLKPENLGRFSSCK